MRAPLDRISNPPDSSQAPPRPSTAHPACPMVFQLTDSGALLLSGVATAGYGAAMLGAPRRAHEHFYKQVSRWE